MATYSVSGKTYQYQETIKRLGGTWDADLKVWIVDAEAAKYLSTASNFGRKAIRLGTGMVITPMVGR